jgi:hypothetical protein
MVVLVIRRRPMTFHIFERGATVELVDDGTDLTRV